MRIVLTGVSSFTGAWFAAALARAGHTVVGTLQRSAGDYSGVPGRRLAMCEQAGVAFAPCLSYGSPELLELIDQGWDAIGYHGADVRDYRSPAFDLNRALEANTRGAQELCTRAVAAGVGRLIVSSTVFEPFAGRGDLPERAVTPYGLSKALSWEVLRFHAEAAGLPIAKFVIANPFGPLEQDRFCTYLASSWLGGKVPGVRTPDYVRDNVPVDRLADAYADFAAHGTSAVCAPSGYVGTQGEFTARFAGELGPRLGIPVPFSLARQTDFTEPLTRIALHPITAAWDETKFWDILAAYYVGRFGSA